MKLYKSNYEDLSKRFDKIDQSKNDKKNLWYFWSGENLMGIVNITNEFMKKIIGDLNKFTLLQLVWIISIYYFVLNSICKYLSKLDETTKLPNIDFILKYNKQVLKFLNDYEYTWIILTILLFYTAIIVVLVSCTIFENYTFIRTCSIYGGDLSAWSTIIYITYKLYMCTGIYYSIILILISYTVYWSKEHKQRFFDKFV